MEDGLREGADSAPADREPEAGPVRPEADRTREPEAPHTELPEWLARKLFRIFR